VSFVVRPFRCRFSLLVWWVVSRHFRSELVVEDASSQKSTEFQDVVYAMFQVLICVTGVHQFRRAFRLWSIVEEIDPYRPLCSVQSLFATEDFAAYQHQANL